MCSLLLSYLLGYVKSDSSKKQTRVELMDIQTLAEQCQSYLTRKTRDNGEVFVTQADYAPEWFSGMVYKCHDGLLPNDWVYSAIESSIDDLAVGYEHPEPDTSRSRAWFYDFPDSDYFCDESFFEIGMPKNGIGDLIVQGMYFHFDQVFHQVKFTLEGQLAEMDSDNEQ